jgi:Ser/Thr protein kinase RdoA (MazF antagonist)
MGMGVLYRAAMQTIAEAVAAALADWERPPVVERAVLGTDDPTEIDHLISAISRAALGAEIVACVFYESGVGCVFGLELADDRQAVVKVHPVGVTRPQLRTVADAQRHLADAGFPCPLPLADPVSIGRTWATFEKLVARDSHRDGHDPVVRRAMARTLWALVDTARPFAVSHDLGRDLLRELPPDQLWPEPHDARFDFERTAGGAEWIDTIAKHAREHLAEATGEVVVGHSDWSVKNFAFSGDRVAAVYDWDSLAVDFEPVFVGEAVHAFPATWYIETAVAPTPEEAGAFVAEYEWARGRPFTAAEMETVRAAADYAMAYSARCAHSDDPEGAFIGPGTTRDLLARHGRVLP